MQKTSILMTTAFFLASSTTLYAVDEGGKDYSPEASTSGHPYLGGFTDATKEIADIEAETGMEMPPGARKFVLDMYTLSPEAFAAKEVKKARKALAKAAKESTGD